MSKQNNQSKTDDHFKSGVKRLFAKHIWNKMAREIAESFKIDFPIKRKGYKTKIAGEIQHTSYDYSRFEDGRMSDQAIYVAMTLLGWKGESLDDLPDVESRAIAGYQMVIYRKMNSDKKDKWPKDDDLIKKHVFDSVRVLLKIGMNNGVDLGLLSDVEWQELYSNKFASHPDGWNGLKSDFMKYRHVVTEAVDEVSYRWLEDT